MPVFNAVVKMGKAAVRLVKNAAKNASATSRKLTDATPNNTLYEVPQYQVPPPEYSELLKKIIATPEKSQGLLEILKEKSSGVNKLVAIAARDKKI